MSSAAGASLTVSGSDVPRFGCGSAVAAPISTVAAVAFWWTNSLVTAGPRTALLLMSRSVWSDFRLIGRAEERKDLASRERMVWVDG